METQPLSNRKVGGHPTIERRHIRQWRRRRSTEKVAQDPYSPNHRRSPRRVGRDRQYAALPQQSATLAFRRERHAPEAAAIDIGNSVVLRQALVEKGGIRLEQIKHTAIRSHNAIHEEFRLLAERLTKIIVKVRILTDVRIDGRQVAQPEPLSGEVTCEIVRARIGEHPAGLS